MLSDSRSRRLAATTLIALAAGVPQALAAAPAIGSIAPDLLGDDADGRPVHLSGYRGRVVVMTFWASWCAPCIEELSALEQLQRSAGRQQLQVVGINWKEAPARYQEIAQRLAGLQLQLSSDADGRIGERYGVRRIPRMFIIDQDGRVAFVHTGFEPDRSIARVAAEVETLLRKPPAVVLPSS